MFDVTVHTFAMLRDLRPTPSGGTPGEEVVSVAPGTTVEALYRRLFPPGPEGALPVAYAVNEAYTSADTIIREGDEVAFIPPVGGG